jgi:nitrogen fixation protein NifB
LIYMAAHACEQKAFGHPCFDKKSHCSVGRIHLPVAPKCNIKCKFCSRRHDCANENRPGVTSKLISPGQALELVRGVVTQDKRIRVVGIAGPGDPLANEATFETFRLIHREFPKLIKCLSTNGLLLPDRLDELLEVGVGSLTVTINALNPWVGERIYSYAKYKGKVFSGQDAAALLRCNQLLGIDKALSCGLRVKVNSVLIPGINEKELPQLAKVLRGFGVQLMNIMPLIPQAELGHLSPVPVSLLNQVRDECERIIPQFRHCKQCRADAIGIPGKPGKPGTNYSVAVIS